MGASTPHFALQLRERIRNLIRGLPEDHPARKEGEREIARLDQIAFVGEVRGHPAEAGTDAASEPRARRRARRADAPSTRPARRARGLDLDPRADTRAWIANTGERRACLYVYICTFDE